MALTRFDNGEKTTLRPGDVVFHHRVKQAASQDGERGQSTETQDQGGKQRAQAHGQEEHSLQAEHEVNANMFPTHACIYVGPGEDVQSQAECGDDKNGIATQSLCLPRVLVRGVPGYRRSVNGGDEDDVLGTCMTGDTAAWFANLAGQMVAVDATQLKKVVLLSEAVSREHSQLGQQCQWHTRMERDESRLILGEHSLFVRGSCTHFVEYLYEECGIDIVASETVDPGDPDRIYPAVQIAAFWAGSYPLSQQPWDERLAHYPTCLEVLPQCTSR